MDKAIDTLTAALRQALAAPGEQRLFRSGKLPGLFPGRTQAIAEAAARALRDGLLEVVRSEVKGRTTLEWVRITPQGVRFLHDHESPVRAMDELRGVLQGTQEGIPAWLAEIRKHLEDLTTHMTQEVQAIARRLEVLSQRVAEALERCVPSKLPEEVLQAVPWGQEALDYLNQRRGSGLRAPCPLPELFLAVKTPSRELTLADFHAGLRRLSDRGILRLLGHDNSNGLPEPEHALLEGVTTYYYVALGSHRDNDSTARDH
jgi:hypothetical protein